MNGIIIINKEKGYTSNDVVKKIKKLLNTKVGHTGTLDPNATGVLPLLLGDATKISKYIINHNKEYEAILQLGIKTKTADGEGEILQQEEVEKDILQKDNINKILNTFIGKQEQIPPIYSAIKIKGKKLYQYAREGKEVKIEPRGIEIFDINLISINYKENQICFNVKCSKGTYIRSLCENIATKLGTVGYMKELNRIQVGEFNIKDSITISQFEEKINNNDFSSILTLEELFSENKKINLDAENFNKYLNGVKINVDEKNGICRVYWKNEFIGLGVIENNFLKRDIVTINTTKH